MLLYGVSVYATLKVNMVMLKVAIAMVTGGLEVLECLSVAKTAAELSCSVLYTVISRM